MAIQIQYLTDLEGNKKAVLVPIEEWKTILNSYNHLQQLVGLKKGLLDAFKEVKKIESGEAEGKTLGKFLDEC